MRSFGGSSITELGPVLLFIIIAVFFPLLNLSVIGLTYFCCGTLTDLQAEKAAVLPKSETQDNGGPVKNALPAEWEQTGIGKFAHLSEPPQTDVTFLVEGSVQKVRVSTTFSASPFMKIPFIPGVPGISAPVLFTFTSKRVVEDPRNLNK